MYDWLKNEIAEIKTRRFHEVEPSRDGVNACDAFPHPLPPSYCRFIAEIGEARLYRTANYYKITIRHPRSVEAREIRGKAYVRFGSYDSNDAVFEKDLLREDVESPVFEFDGEQLQKVADSFEAWLKKRATSIRKRYSKKEWRAIVEGPSEFSETEQLRVDARRDFKWEFLGLAPNGDLRFRIENRSNLTLPFLTVGVRAKDKSLKGAISLPVAEIAPGETAVIEHSSYKNLVDPKLLEPFPLPDPQPEDRQTYRELWPDNGDTPGQKA